VDYGDGWLDCSHREFTGVVPANHIEYISANDDKVNQQQQQEENTIEHISNDSEQQHLQCEEPELLEFRKKRDRIREQLEKSQQQQQSDNSDENDNNELHDEVRKDLENNVERRMKLQRLSVMLNGSISDIHPLLVSPVWSKKAEGLLSNVSHGGRYIFGVSKNGMVYRYNAYKWNNEPGPLHQVSTCKDGSTWGVSSDHLVYRLKGNRWEKMPGQLTQIHVGSKDHIVGVNRHNHIYKFNIQEHRWDRLPGLATHVSIGADGDMWCAAKDQTVYHYNEDTERKWVLMPGLLVKVHVGKNKYHVVGLNRHGNLFQWIEDQWYRVDQRVYKDISVWRLGKHMAAIDSDDIVYFHE
jgi:hypothetical protein